MPPTSRTICAPSRTPILCLKSGRTAKECFSCASVASEEDTAVCSKTWKNCYLIPSRSQRWSARVARSRLTSFATRGRAITSSILSRATTKWRTCLCGWANLQTGPHWSLLFQTSIQWTTSSWQATVSSSAGPFCHLMVLSTILRCPTSNFAKNY